MVVGGVSPPPVLLPPVKYLAAVEANAAAVSEVGDLPPLRQEVDLAPAQAGEPRRVLCSDWDFLGYQCWTNPFLRTWIAPPPLWRRCITLDRDDAEFVGTQ